MRIEKLYKARLINRESTRASVQRVMDFTWTTIETLSEVEQRRVLTALITEIQIALKQEGE